MTSRQRQKAFDSEMKPGYYILNNDLSGKKGVPKYVYLGPEVPNLVYNRA